MCALPYSLKVFFKPLLLKYCRKENEYLWNFFQAKLLGKELDLVKAAQQKNSEEFEQVENNHRVLEKKLKEKDWELQDMRAMKDAKYV